MKIEEPTKILIGFGLLALATISITSASSLLWGVAGALYAFGFTVGAIGLGFIVAAHSD